MRIPRKKISFFWSSVQMSFQNCRSAWNLLYLFTKLWPSLTPVSITINFWYKGQISSAVTNAFCSSDCLYRFQSLKILRGCDFFKHYIEQDKRQNPCPYFHCPCSFKSWLSALAMWPLLFKVCWVRIQDVNWCHFYLILKVYLFVDIMDVSAVEMPL